MLHHSVMSPRAFAQVLVRFAGVSMLLVSIPAVVEWLASPVREALRGNIAYAMNMLPAPFTGFVKKSDPSGDLIWCGRAALGVYLCLGGTRLAAWMSRKTSGVCPSCGYSTSGLKAESCPECGTDL